MKNSTLFLDYAHLSDGTKLYAAENVRQALHKEGCPTTMCIVEKLTAFPKHHVIPCIQSFRRFIRDHDVTTAYLTCLEGWIDRQLIKACMNENVTIYYSPHGTTPHGRHQKTSHRWKDSDIVFCLGGKAEKRQYLARGIKRENIRLTGLPCIDEANQWEHAGKDHILLLTQPLQYHRYANIIAEQLRKTEKIIMIRPHPREDIKGYYPLFYRMKHAIFDTRNDKESLYADISRAEMTISFGSTTDIEAAIIGVPVINIKLPSTAGPKTAFDKTITSCKPDDLAQTIKSIDAKAQVRRQHAYLWKNYRQTDGKTARRIATMIASATTR